MKSNKILKSETIVTYAGQRHSNKYVCIHLEHEHRHRFSQDTAQSQAVLIEYENPKNKNQTDSNLFTTCPSDAATCSGVRHSESQILTSPFCEAII